MELRFQVEVARGNCSGPGTTVDNFSATRFVSGGSGWNSTSDARSLDAWGLLRDTSAENTIALFSQRSKQLRFSDPLLSRDYEWNEQLRLFRSADDVTVGNSVEPEPEKRLSDSFTRQERPLLE